MRTRAVGGRKITYNVTVVTKSLNVFVLLLFCLFVCCFCQELYYLLTLLEEKSLYLLLNKNAVFDSGH